MNNAKKEFIDAYVWLCGTTKGEALQVYKNADECYIASVILTYRKSKG